MKKQVRHRAAKPRVAVPEENETAPRKQKAVVDARAELLRSAPAETSQPTPPAPEFKVVDAASVLATGTAAFVPPAPVEKRATDQLTPDHATPREVDVKTLLAAAPAPSDAVAASVSGARSPFPPPRQAMTGGSGGNLAWHAADGSGARLRLGLEPDHSGGRAVARLMRGPGWRP